MFDQQGIYIPKTVELECYNVFILNFDKGIEKELT
jgi:hypothetical protein